MKTTLTILLLAVLMGCKEKQKDVVSKGIPVYDKNIKLHDNAPLESDTKSKVGLVSGCVINGIFSPYPNYDSMYVIGKTYTIYDAMDDPNDPFELKKHTHKVVVTDKQNGYVQFRYAGSKQLNSCDYWEFYYISKPHTKYRVSTS